MKQQLEHKKGEKYHFEHELLKEERRYYKPATFTYDEQGRRIPKKIMKKKKKEIAEEKLDTISQDDQTETPQIETVDRLIWLVLTSLFSWYFWTYRTIFGLCLLLWPIMDILNGLSSLYGHFNEET